VAVSDRRGISKTPVAEVHLEPEWGIQGDAHGGAGHRQVSLLAVESINKARDAGLDVGPGDFAENVAAEGLDLRALPVGARLAVGAALTEVTQIGKACHTPCAIGLRYRAGARRMCVPARGHFCESAEQRYGTARRSY